MKNLRQVRIHILLCMVALVLILSGRYLRRPELAHAQQIYESPGITSSQTAAPCASLLSPVTEVDESANVQFLGEKTVAEIIPGARAGENLSPEKTLHVWHDATRNIYVGIDPDSGWGDRELTALWRSLDLVEQEFPSLFTAVFLASNDGNTTFLTRPDPAPWVNKNRVSAFIVIAQEFQSADKQAIATNYYSLGPANENVYENVPFIGINPGVIDGDIANLGPQPIYPACSREGAKTAYLNEGLGDTLLHERIHGFISQFYGHDQLFEELRQGGNQSLCEYNVEELLIKQYLLEEYSTHPDSFSEPFWQYWQRDEQILAANVQETPCYTRISELGLLEGQLLNLP